MKKFIRIALPWVCFSVIIWYFGFGGINHIDLKWVIGAAGIGGVSYAVLSVKLHEMLGKTGEHCNQLKAQAEEAVAPELEKVKGNSLKKKIVKRRLVREYIKSHYDDCSEEDVAIENIRGWLRSLKRCFYIICFCVIALPILLIFMLEFYSSGGSVPSQIDYHNAGDLRKVTGVEFPEIVPVDSFYLYDGLASDNTIIKFVPVKPLDKDFFHRLDQACKTDSCCWRKDSTGYSYNIFPEAIPFDRTKGMHRRMVDVDGEKVPDWDGTYIYVFVPIKGDTIILNDGWTR